MDLFSNLLTDPRAARRQITDWMMSALTHGRFSEEFFDAAGPHCELQLVRCDFSKNRQR
jgi:hypothetical protein